jgi:secreted trypsin-like serine protease
MRRARLRALLALALAGAVPALPAHAIMAGAFPDTPAARVDANVDTSPWRGVVAIQTPAGIFTGATLGRRHVLTAAHVFDSLPAAADVQVIFNLSAGAVQRAVVRYTRHPDYVAFGVPDLRHDLALIELAADRPAASLAYAIPAVPPAAGAVVTVVGYGASGNGNFGGSVPRSVTVRRVGRNVLDVLIADGTGTVRLFHWDFDGPTAATNFLGGPTLGNALETTLAGGDSGAPVFVEAGGAPALVALGSFTGALKFSRHLRRRCSPAATRGPMPDEAR